MRRCRFCDRACGRLADGPSTTSSDDEEDDDDELPSSMTAGDPGALALTSPAARRVRALAAPLFCVPLGASGGANFAAARRRLYAWLGGCTSSALSVAASMAGAAPSPQGFPPAVAFAAAGGEAAVATLETASAAAVAAACAKPAARKSSKPSDDVGGVDTPLVFAAETGFIGRPSVPTARPTDEVAAVAMQASSSDRTAPVPASAAGAAGCTACLS
jgi:hypothetical protein